MPNGDHVATGVHRDPFNELEVDALVAEPGGGQHRVPCYRAGRN